jgi:hypothetical protein
VSHHTRHAQGTFTELRKGRVRLVGAVLTEQNDEWTEARRYMGPEILAACKKGRNTTETNENGVTAEAIGARIDIDHEVAFSYTTSWDVTPRLKTPALDEWVDRGPTGCGLIH